jgi:hypothetical protein
VAPCRIAGDYWSVVQSQLFQPVKQVAKADTQQFGGGRLVQYCCVGLVRRDFFFTSSFLDGAKLLLNVMVMTKV